MTLLNCESGVSVANPEQLSLDSEFHAMTLLSVLYDKEIISIIGWAKHVPGRVKEAFVILQFVINLSFCLIPRVYGSYTE